MAAADLALRVAGDRDRPAVLALCRASLGWAEGDPNESFFRWKHDENPFGASPMWVAETNDGELAGVRAFLRWRFRSATGKVLHAVRAVDTATHPDWQGKGIFTRLTLGALPDLAEMGTDLIFNTPNDKSRPGYLKMGWETVGRVPVAIRIRSIATARNVLGARVAASKWSEEVSSGCAATEMFDDDDAVSRLLSGVTRNGISTDRDAAYLRWRYRFGPLHYRAMLMGDHLTDGVVVFRVRRRGSAREATICEVLAPRGRSPRSAIRRILGETGADYALRTGGIATVTDGFLPAPTLGPVLMWKPIRSLAVPTLDELSLSLGDVELF